MCFWLKIYVFGLWLYNFSLVLCICNVRGLSFVKIILSNVYDIDINLKIIIIIVVLIKILLLLLLIIILVIINGV